MNIIRSNLQLIFALLLLSALARYSYMEGDVCEGDLACQEH